MCVPILRVHRQSGVLTHIGGSVTDGWLLPGITPWGLTIDEAATLIDSRQWDFFVEVPAGTRVPVLAKTSSAGKRFLTTSPDGIAANNLEALPDLPLPLAGVLPWFPLSLPGTSLVSQTSVQDAHYRYKPSASFLDPDPGWKDEHAGPFAAGNRDLPVPKEFWSGGSHMLRLAAVVPFLATYSINEYLVFGTTVSARPVERVLVDDIERRLELEAQGKGWWTWDFVLTKPDGSIDPSKPSRLTEIRIAIRPSDSAWTHNDFVVALEVRGTNPYCSAYASVSLHIFTAPKVPLPPPPKCPLPNVVGLHLDKAFDALASCHLNILVVGNTTIDTSGYKVAAQSVSPGTPVEQHSELILRVEPVSSATTGWKELLVTNASSRAKPLDLWLFDYTVGGWTKKGTVATSATMTVPLVDKHSQVLAAVDPSNPPCTTARPDELKCVAWQEIAPRLGASSGPSDHVTIV